MKKNPPHIANMKSPGRGRDRLATQERIIKAVGTLLARDGFMALGVNSVAKEAGIDKVLIYRYFGGMPELLRAFGKSEAFWPSVSEMTGNDMESLLFMPLAESVPAVFSNFIRALRRRPVTIEIMAWELVEQNELTEVLREVREEMSIRLFDVFAAKLNDVDADIRALITLLSAAVSYLLLRRRDTKIYNTMDIRSDAGWERIEKTAGWIIKQLLLPKKDA